MRTLLIFLLTIGLFAADKDAKPKTLTPETKAKLQTALLKASLAQNRLNDAKEVAQQEAQKFQTALQEYQAASKNAADAVCTGGQVDLDQNLTCPPPTPGSAK